MSSRNPSCPFQTSGSSKTSSTSTASAVKQAMKESTSPVSSAQQYLAIRSWMATRSSMPGLAGLDMSYLPTSETGRAAIDQEVDTGDEARLAAGREQHRGGDFLGRTHAVHGCVADHLLAQRRDGLRRKAGRTPDDGRIGGPRAHHVDA